MPNEETGIRKLLGMLSCSGPNPIHVSVTEPLVFVLNALNPDHHTIVNLHFTVRFLTKFNQAKLIFYLEKKRVDQFSEPFLIRSLLLGPRFFTLQRKRQAPLWELYLNLAMVIP